MKFLVSILISVFCVAAGLAQTKDIEIFEKKDGNKNIVIARNIGKVPYLVTIDINAIGMDVTPSIKAEAVVPAGYMKEMATLVPRQGESWSYGYEVSFIEYSGGPVSAASSNKTPATPNTSTPESESKVAVPVPSAPALTPEASASNAPIVIYTQAGCGRCAFVKKEMNSRSIAYKEIDVNSGSPEVNEMWMALRKGGFTGDSVTMPVVKVNGQLHYNIKDLPKFIDELEKSE